MPVYCYICPKCGEESEVQKSFALMDSTEYCSVCAVDGSMDMPSPAIAVSKQELKRISFPGSAFHLKGKGWFRSGGY